MEANSQARTSRRIPIADLTRTLRTIIADLHQSGLTDSQARDVFASELSAKCALCGLLLSGNELGQIAGREELGSNKKLARVSLGRCGEETCSASFYNISHPANPTTPWAELWQSAEKASKVTQEEEEQAELELSLVDQPSRIRKTVVAFTLCAIALSLIYWRLRTPGWSSRPSPYLIDPSSTRPTNY